MEQETNHETAIEDILKEHHAWCENGEVWKAMIEALVDYCNEYAFDQYVQGMKDQEGYETEGIKGVL